MRFVRDVCQSGLLRPFAPSALAGQRKSTEAEAANPGAAPQSHCSDARVPEQLLLRAFGRPADEFGA
eukprot:7915995-Alexandrium_andersonii.AAC.1